ncbi:hypothetical protein ABKW28_10465 [Nocardioides sp. 31GB23]|uniref:Uncharacterized protein n=1 Tax=Nocardioides salarius TaxID=374513 RepID=A0ABS2M9U3_9ACTN|nr:hypothetical protein [Nocardioides salarius]MBM7507951.1 hypothetical protein [Nocardioides salarius]
MTQQLRTTPDTPTRSTQPPPPQLTLIHGRRDPALETAPDPARERARANALRDRHSEGLTRLMSERADLRGVNALADLVDDAVRWSV